MQQNHPQGFTVIEMLLVIGLIALLAVILLPKFKAANQDNTTGNTMLPKDTQAGMIHKTHSKE